MNYFISVKLLNTKSKIFAEGQRWAFSFTSPSVANSKNYSSPGNKKKEKILEKYSKLCMFDIEFI